MTARLADLYAMPAGHPEVLGRLFFTTVGIRPWIYKNANPTGRRSTTYRPPARARRMW